MIRELPGIEIPGHQSSGLGSDDHPMRIMTRRAAGLAPGGWDAEARAEVAAFFDELAPVWHTRTSPERDASWPTHSTGAWPRSRRRRIDVCVELGSGIGAYTPTLAERWSTVVAVEVSLEMARRAPAGVGHRVLADGADLPLPAQSVDAIVIVNAFLFPAEVDRILGSGGVVVWVNSSGSGTPIYLPVDDIAAALPGDWDGVTSTAGEGLWAVLRRAVA